METKHVVVVERNRFQRELLSVALESNGLSVGQAGSVSAAKRAFDLQPPDAVVLDMDLGKGGTGLELAEYAREISPRVGLVFLTNLPDPRFIGREPKSLPENSAYLRKGQLGNLRELLAALDAVLRNRASVKYRHDLDSTRPLAKLSRMQLTVLALVSKGLSNSQIADHRGTTVRAVEGMVGRVFETLNIDSAGDGNARVEAAIAYLTALGQG